MINNWEIFSSLQPKTKSLLYHLVIDGTEHDARLIAKKLSGYAKAPEPALAPYVYSFELPADLDEDTVEKIRTAVREGVELTNKINQFVPGGVLGEPLFNGETGKEDKDFPTFMTLDPSTSFFKDSAQQTPDFPLPDSLEVEQHAIRFDHSDELDLQKQTIAPPQEEIPGEEFLTSPDSAEAWPDNDKAPLIKTTPPPTCSEKEETKAAEELSINDKDMLIKDMEGTLLDQMPLEDIFSAETKYDMFLDLENQKLVKSSQVQREQKMSALADGKDSLEETFNVFEQKIKDQTCIIDLEDLSNITQRIPQKDLSFVKDSPAAQTLQIHAQDVSAPSEPAQDIALNAPGEATAAVAAETAAPSEEAPKEVVLSITPPTLPINEKTPAKPMQKEQADLPAIPTLKTVAMPKEPLEVDLPCAAQETLQETSANAPTKEPEEMLSFLGHNKEEQPAPVLPKKKEQTEPENKPEELCLETTTPPVSSFSTRSAPTEEADLPAMTVRVKSLADLEKTFNLETTIKAEVIKSQYLKTRHDIKDQKPTAPPDEREKEQQCNAKHKNIRILGKKQPIKQNTDFIGQNIITEGNKAGKLMAENNEEKTTFRIRKIQREKTLPPMPPLPPAQPAPAAPTLPTPAEPAAPTPAPAVPTLPTPAEPAAPVEQKTFLRGGTSANTFIEKTKTIDHSIELPLSELKKHNWPLEVPLVPTFTMENMVMSVNRFAHATAISVVDNPGRLYNPLVLHGPTGTGKTHFLNAIGYALSKKYGQENIFMTNGVRLSRGIQRYVMENNIEKFEKFMDSVKAILIDDIHLIAINEQNRVHISRLLNNFLKEHKQIVITSKYPPESLEKLEELIEFKLDSGWISELKTAQGATHFRIVKKMLSENGINITDAQISEFFSGPSMTLGTVARSIRRVKVLEKIVFPNKPVELHSQAKIFDKLLATAGEDETSQILSKDPDEITSIPNIGNGEWGRIGFFYPQNSSHMMNWMVYALSQRAKELGIEGGFEIAVRSSYSTENIISSAFKIANLCDNKKLKGAVILGPALQFCEPSVRENFYDILTHMLEVMLIRCGIINFEEVKSPSTYVKILSELMR